MEGELGLGGGRGRGGLTDSLPPGTTSQVLRHLRHGIRGPHAPAPCSPVSSIDDLFCLTYTIPFQSKQHRRRHLYKPSWGWAQTWHGGQGGEGTLGHLRLAWPQPWPQPLSPLPAAISLAQKPGLFGYSRDSRCQSHSPSFLSLPLFSELSHAGASLHL